MRVSTFQLPPNLEQDQSHLQKQKQSDYEVLSQEIALLNLQKKVPFVLRKEGPGLRTVRTAKTQRREYRVGALERKRRFHSNLERDDAHHLWEGIRVSDKRR